MAKSKKKSKKGQISSTNPYAKSNQNAKSSKNTSTVSGTSKASNQNKSTGLNGKNYSQTVLKGASDYSFLLNLSQLDPRNLPIPHLPPLLKKETSKNKSHDTWEGFVAKQKDLKAKKEKSLMNFGYSATKRPIGLDAPTTKRLFALAGKYTPETKAAKKLRKSGGVSDTTSTKEGSVTGKRKRTQGNSKNAKSDNTPVDCDSHIKLWLMNRNKPTVETVTGDEIETKEYKDTGTGKYPSPGEGDGIQDLQTSNLDENNCNTTTSDGNNYLLKHGINHIMSLIRDKKAKLVIIGYFFDSTDTTDYLPVYCDKHNVPYCFVKDPRRLAHLVNKKDVSAVAFSEIRPEDNETLAQLIKDIKEANKKAKEEEDLKHAFMTLASQKQDIFKFLYGKMF